MRIQPINNLHNYNFKGKFEYTPELEEIIEATSDKDLMEFSLMLDIINNKNDDKIYFINKKKETIISPEKGYVLWCQEHWDSFPKTYKCIELNDMYIKKQMSQALDNFTQLLKALYNANFESDLKMHFKNQIQNKLKK